MTNILNWAIRRAKPREGWLPLLLLVAIVVCLITAVLDVAWVPEDGVVISATLGGFLLGSVLAKRPLSTLPTWILLTLYGMLIAVGGTANLWPTWAALRGGWVTLRSYWLQNGALFLDRVIGWGTAVFNNQSSQETIVFALGLALLSYFLTAFACWQLFRRYRPFAGLLAIGLGLALNGYFGGGQIWPLGVFVGLTAVLIAITNHTALTDEWDANQVDYSEEARLDLLLHATAIAFILLALAISVPSLKIQAIIQRFQAQPGVQQTEAALERAFGGVEGRGSQPGGPDGVGGGGILPRSFLLENAPELYETVVMTAVVQTEANVATVHWRGLSYDVYTGRGWALSEERTEQLNAEARISLPPVAATATVSQTVYWLADERLTRYSLGLPQQFSQPARAIWRGQTDLVRIYGEDHTYSLLSQVSQATPEMLRETAVANIPPAILARYTALPGSVPQRVHDLAREIAGNQTNPYDQARAIEQFLRQYPYSLEIDRPPRNEDPVDYFLFEQQAGYCDFYASAMVVLARSMGLPARLAAGYMPQPPDANDVQTIYQINGHTWAEIYFAEFGWIEFEPTAAFASPHTTPANGNNQPPNFEPQTIEREGTDALELPPVPQAAEERPFPWLLLIGGMITVVAFWQWRRSQLPTGADAVLWSYGRWQQQAAKLGYPPQPNQTPQEFLAAFEQFLAGYGRSPRLSRLLTPIYPHLARLTALYMRRRYAGDAQSGRVQAWESWGKVKRPLYLLRIVRLFANRRLYSTQHETNSTAAKKAASHL